MTAATSASPLYLLDTNILLHYVRRDTLGQWVEVNYSLLTTPTVPLISIVSEGELRSLGLQRAWGATRMQQLEFLLTSFSRVSLDEPGIVEAYAALDAYCESTGNAIGKNDLWIAATANVTGATLLTTDRDFDHLHPNYVVRDWIDPRP